MSFKTTDNPSYREISAILPLMRFLKQHTSMVCLGDTDHRFPLPRDVVFHADFMRGLRVHGYQHVFLELSRDACLRVDRDVNMGKISYKRAAKKIAPFFNAWLHPDISYRHALSYLNSGRHQSGISYIPVDLRLETVSGRLSFGDKLSLLCSKRGIKSTLDALNPTARFVPSRVRRIVDSADYLINKGALEGIDGDSWLIDDRASLDLVLKHSKPDETSLLLYGAGHFNGDAEFLGLPSFYSGLSARGYNPIWVNVYDLERYHKVELSREVCRFAAVDLVRCATRKTWRAYFKEPRMLAAFQSYQREVASFDLLALPKEKVDPSKSRVLFLASLLGKRWRARELKA